MTRTTMEYLIQGLLEVEKRGVMNCEVRRQLRRLLKQQKAKPDIEDMGLLPIRR